MRSTVSFIRKRRKTKLEKVDVRVSVEVLCDDLGWWFFELRAETDERRRGWIEGEGERRTGRCRTCWTRSVLRAGRRVASSRHGSNRREDVRSIDRTSLTYIATQCQTDIQANGGDEQVPEDEVQFTPSANESIE